MRNRKLREASTIKARAQRMVKDMDEMLKDKALPDDLRKSIESLRTSLRKTWSELATGAALANGRKGLTPAEKPKEAAVETETQPDGADLEEGHFADIAAESMGDYVPWGVTSFAQLDATHAAHEMAEELQERAAQFSAMVSNILTADALTVPDKPAAMRSLFEEFMLVIEDAFVSAADDASMMDAEPVEPMEPDAEPAAEVHTEAEAAPLAETETFAESFETGAVLLAEASPDTLTMMDVQIIQPGWGNSRDNHFYSAEMLRRDAEKFVGAKMYETDHRPEEKNTKNWVSTVKEIVRFTAEGAPVARVAIHDPSFSERVRNLAATNLLEKMECSILANGSAKPFEMNGRKGKQVEAITDVSSVDWVTKAGAGGKALNLAESDAQPEPEQPAGDPAPVAETVASTEAQTSSDPVVIHEQEAQAVVEEAAPPVYLDEAAVSEALAKTNLPAASALALLKGEYLDAAALVSAISAETKRIKEISGSGRPFAMGESSAVSNAAKPIPRQKIEETMDKINSKFFGR